MACQGTVSAAYYRHYIVALKLGDVLLLLNIEGGIASSRGEQDGCNGMPREGEPACGLSIELKFKASEGYPKTATPAG